jgi:dihydropteroate synthase
VVFAEASLSVPRYRPIPQSEALRPEGALPLAGGPLWFAEVAVHERGALPRLMAARDLPAAARERLSRRREAVCGLDLDRPRIMGVVNVTPDSFSDGGRFARLGAAVAQGLALAAAGADLLDVGGESTRPGSDPVPEAEERARVVPVIAALRAEGVAVPISVDTRKASVLEAALAAGADVFNDVSALGFDPASAAAAARAGCPVCLMHAQGDPKTMQVAPRYDDVLLDVADFLEKRVAAAEAAGIARGRVLVDPGLGFGKTVAHNLALVRGLALLHDLGCAVVFGASRKRFIGSVAGVEVAAERVPGSIAVALEALRQGAQVLRVHDVAETRQAVALWSALVDAGGEAASGR